ncbi:MAG: DUF2341 domain-containing protein, partial [Lentisphaerae bacterium]|nr:DUF2341 domain-containing protein [Lentisphaerota bacterium]
PPYGDLRFVSADDAPLDFEVESWNVNGLSHVWVKVPELSLSTTIYALWGKEGVTEPDCTSDGSVWSANFEGVWHLDEQNSGLGAGEGIFFDSTGNDNVGYEYVKTTDKTGFIAGGLVLSGSAEYVQINNTFANQIWTKSFWFRPVKNTGFQAFCSLGNTRTDGSPDLYLRLNADKIEVLAVGMGNYASVDSFIVDDWHYCVVTRNGQTLRIYINGTQKYSGTIGAERGKSYLYIGAGANGTFQGYMDEVRCSSIDRSADWIQASWLNQKTNSNFIEYGDPETYKLPSVNNAYGASDVTGNSATLNGSLLSMGMSETAVTVYWGVTDGGNDMAKWDSHFTWDAPQIPGDFAHQISVLSPETLYYFRFKAENEVGVAWADKSSVFITSEVWFDQVFDAEYLGKVPGEVTVNRKNTLTGASLNVYYSITGTAVEGVDYVELSGFVTIPAGETSTKITIQPLQLDTMTASKTVRLDLLSGPAILGDPSATELQIFVENFGAWRKRMPIEFPGYTESESLTNFPVLIVLENTGTPGGFSYDGFSSGTYADLRFATDDKRTPLDFEIESWDPSGKSYVWVKIPELTASTTIYALWGQDSAKIPLCTINGSVWTEKFKGVWHLNELNSGQAVGAPIFLDATANGNDGADYVKSLDKTGLIGGGLSLNGSSDYVRVNDPVSDMSNWTLSFWFYPLKMAANHALVSIADTIQSYSPAVYLRLNTDKLQVLTPGSDYTNLGAFEDGAWNYCVLSREGEYLTVHLNGTERYSGRRSNLGAPDNLFLGSGANGRFYGRIDEARICSLVRSPNWIQTCWINQGIENSSFCNLGVVEGNLAEGTIYFIF